MERSEELLQVHEALDRLATDEPRKAQVVELRFLGGLSVEEIAGILEVSTRTVKREWNFARAWLFREITGRFG